MNGLSTSPEGLGLDIVRRQIQRHADLSSVDDLAHLAADGQVLALRRFCVSTFKSIGWEEDRLIVLDQCLLAEWTVYVDLLEPGRGGRGH